jgi:hypothetical protein
MTRNNLAVCFSPVIFRFSLEKKANLKQSKLDNSNSYSSKTITNNTISTISNDNASTKTINNPSVSSYLVSLPTSFEISPPVSCGGETNRLNKQSSIDLKLDSPLSISINEELLNKSAKSINQLNGQTAQPTLTPNTTHSTSKSNYKRKYSEKINKAASSLVNVASNFSAELSSSKSSTFFSESFKENLESMSKVIQLCVSDMIKYSMDLFTVPSESFEKLNLHSNELLNTEPHNLEYFYDRELKKLKIQEFFQSNVKIDKTYWSYQDKFEDVSIYFCKNDTPDQQMFNLIFPQSKNSIQLQSLINPISQNSISNTQQSSNNNHNLPIGQGSIASLAGSSSIITATTAMLIPSKLENFVNKLKLWKCCTLIKKQNLTLEKILNRIRNERFIYLIVVDTYKNESIVLILKAFMGR